MSAQRARANGFKTPQSRRANSVSPDVADGNKMAVEAGAVDKAQFEKAFAQTTPLHFAGVELEKQLSNIHDVLSSTGVDWEKRVDQLKRLRSLVEGGAAEQKEFQLGMKQVDIALQTAVKDLRSSLVREACITLSYMAEKLGFRFERTAEMTLPSLLTLIPNSARIMASSGYLAVRYILENVPSQKLVPIITQEYLASKSKETRRACCEFLRICLTHFPKSALDRHVGTMQAQIKRGISDADSLARSSARQAYSALAVAYPAAAQEIYDSLDASKKKLLDEAPSISTSQSSLFSSASKTSKARPAPVPSASMVKSATIDHLPKATPTRPLVPRTPPVMRAPISQRSISAVDAAAAKRARDKLTATMAIGNVKTGSALPKLTNGGTHFQRSFRRYSGDKDKKMETTKTTLNHTHHFGDNMAAWASGDKAAGQLTLQQEAEAISDIVAQLVSSASKRDGLLNLQRYMARGYSLLPSEMELLRTSFVRLLSEQAGHIITLLLETLHDFVRIYNLELGSWLYVLLTKLWNKQGQEQGTNVQAKLDKLYHLIRRSFPVEVQLQHILRYMSDPGAGPAPNSKSKGAVLAYLVNMLEDDLIPPDQLPNSSTTKLGLTKVITWALEGQTPDVRRLSQEVLVLLHHLNPTQLDIILKGTDKQIYEAGMKLIRIYPRRASQVLAEWEKKRATPSPSRSPMKTSVGSASAAGRSKPNDENINPAANHLRKAAKVQTPVAASSHNPTSNHAKDILDVGQYLADWSTVFRACPPAKRGRMLERLDEIMGGLGEDVWAEHFSVVLPMLYSLLHDEKGHLLHDSETVAGLLRCLSTLLRVQPQRMRQYPELTLVSLLDVQRDATSTVMRAVDECILLAVRTFPCEVVVQILMPIISLADSNDGLSLHPECVPAIRLFALLCQQTPPHLLLPHFPTVIPLLITAFSSHEESSVRKEAVYALIYAKLAVGEKEMENHLVRLPVSKLRLFNVYYKRIAQNATH